MHIKRISAAVVLAIWLSLSIATAQTAPSLSSEMRARTFEKVWETVNARFWDPTFGGVDWAAMHKSYGAQVPGVKTDADFYALLAKMLGELKTSHLDILNPEMVAKLKQTPVILGLGYREIEGRVVITKVMAGTAAADSPLKEGFIITSVNGMPIKTFGDMQSVLGGAAQPKIRVGYLDEKDGPHEIDLDRRPIGEDNKSNLSGVNFYALFEQKRVAGNIGYFRFTNFLEFLNPQIKAAVESMHDAPGIVIDLRGNSGGDDSVGLKMANLFFAKETLLMITKTRKGDVTDYKTRGSKDAFTGPVVILVDEYSRSASEEFAAGMQESGRVVVIGKTTAGGDMDGEFEKLPDGSMFLVAIGQPRTPKGYIVEGHGVKPNIDVSLTRKNLLAGRDDQLEAAIEYIKAHKKVDFTP